MTDVAGGIRAEAQQTKRLAAAIAKHTGFVDAYALWKAQLMKSQMIVLTYHGIEAGQDEFSQRDAITAQSFKKYARIVQSVQEREPLRKKALCVTIDDGYKDSYTCAYPIFRKYGVPATIFLATGHVDGDLFWWDKVKYIVHHTSVTQFELDELGSHSLKSSLEKRRVSYLLMERLKDIPQERKTQLVQKHLCSGYS